MKSAVIATIIIFSTLAFADGKKITVNVAGMTCPSCAGSVEGEFKKLPEVDDIDISLSKGVVTLTLKEGQDLKEEAVRTAVKEAGFKVTSVSKGQ